MSVRQRLEHEGVEGIRAGRFNAGINTTVIIYRLGSILVDTGPPNQWASVGAFVREKPLKTVLLTHHHEDHAGNAARIAQETGARVLAPERSLCALEKGFPLRPYQRIVWGVPSRMKAEVLGERFESDEGFALERIDAPGHAPDMAALLEPTRKWLFTADLFVAAKPRYLRQDEDVGQTIETLSMLLEYDFETVFCAHRGVVEHGRDMLREKRDFLVSLRQEAQEWSERGASVEEIARKLLGKEDLTTFLTGGHFAKRNLVESCLASESWGAPGRDD